MEHAAGGGWIDYTLEKILEGGRVQISFCVPSNEVGKGYTVRQDGDLSLYMFGKETWASEEYDTSVEEVCKSILLEASPDVVHIYGTEFPHTLSMMRALRDPGRAVIHLQGLIQECALHYMDGMDLKGLSKLEALLFKKRMQWQQRKFQKRGIYEREALRLARHVMGRTDWDRACAAMIHPDIQYHYCPETLRKNFYGADAWDLKACRRHRIFMSQGGYPIKGLHIALEAMRTIVRRYPDARLCIAGDMSRFQKTSGKSLAGMGSYEDYIQKKIEIYGLENNIEFLGVLSAEGMVDEYRKCNVYILPSTIENSPNSLLEALALGVPAVASFVGGVPDFLIHGYNGYSFPINESFMLSHYIMKIFQEDVLAERLSENARSGSYAQKGAAERNVGRILEIYDEIARSNRDDGM